MAKNTSSRTANYPKPVLQDAQTVKKSVRPITKDARITNPIREKKEKMNVFAQVKIISWNANGLQNKVIDLAAFLHQNDKTT